MSVRAFPEPDHNPPRVRLELTSISKDPETNVSRVNPDGSTVLVREPVRLTAGRGNGYDYESPFELPVTFRESAAGQESSVPVALGADAVWLTSPFRPGASVRLDVASRDVSRLQAGTWQQRSRPSSRVLVQPYGPRDPIVVTSGGRRGHSSTLTVRTPTDAAANDLANLVDDDRVLWLNVPPSLGLGVESMYVSVGDIDEVRRDTHGADPVRLWTLPYTRVQRPFGRLRAVWTWDEVPQTFATWEDLEATYRTWEDFETDTRRVVG